MADAPLASGTLRERPLPRLLYACEQRRLTGAVEIDAPDGLATVFVRDGWPVAVRTARIVDTLGQMLLEMGAISVGAYHESLMRLAKEKRRHGEILREMGALDTANLRRGLEAQLKRKIVKLFSVQDGAFRIVTRDHDEGRGESDGIRLDPRWVIVQGVKNSYTPERLSLDLGRLAGQNLRVAAGFWPAEGRYGLAPEDRRALELLKRFLPRAEFERQSGLGALLADMVLYALWVTDGLEVQASGPGQAPRLAKVTAAVEIDPTSALRMRVESKARGLDDLDHFAVLEIERTATPERIKTAYMEMSKTFHPDRLAAAGLGELRAQGERIFARVGEANRVLGDDKTRADYVAQLNKPKPSKEEQAKVGRVMEAEMAFQKGQTFLRRGDYARAEEQFRAALKANPDEAEFHAAMAWTMFSDPKADKKRVVPEAKRMLAKARELSPKSPVPHFYLGKVFAAEGNDARAIEHLREALELKPDHLDAEREIRIIVMRQEKAKKAGLFGGLFKKK
jgi:curved DNA-binding protein CbpA